mmetsp:Transcript_18696/g.70736  ORF Transcript_18696/g.70736 Transcript_18696/m.70736 type:complete len:231 (-) Transcript_18696:707-1399(-)
MEVADSTEARLKALANPEWASDDEQPETAPDEIKLPASKAPKSKRQRRREAAKARAQSQQERESDVVYLGHIPHGFYEREMKGFFSQFGELKRLKLSRSRKTGGSKGYAFLQFGTPEIARIVAETMDGYFLAEKKLVCEVVPVEKVHEKMFAGANRRFARIDWVQKERERREKGAALESRRAERRARTMRAKRRQLEALGIDYGFDFPERANAKPAKAAKVDESSKAEGD